MAILATDLTYRLSTTAGAAGNAGAGTIAGALGKYISTTVVSATAANNLHENVTGDENAASAVFYKCVFVHNAHATLTWTAPVLWLSAETAGGASLALGVDPTATSALAAAAAQAVQVASRTTAPTGVTFSAPTTKASGLALGNIGPGQVKAFWVRLTTANTAAATGDGGTWRTEGDTAG